MEWSAQFVTICWETALAPRLRVALKKAIKATIFLKPAAVQGSRWQYWRYIGCFPLASPLNKTDEWLLDVLASGRLTSAGKKGG